MLGGATGGEEEEKEEEGRGCPAAAIPSFCNTSAAPRYGAVGKVKAVKIEAAEPAHKVTVRGLGGTINIEREIFGLDCVTPSSGTVLPPELILRAAAGCAAPNTTRSWGWRGFRVFCRVTMK